MRERTPLCGHLRPGRYFIKSYDSVNISAFPSLAYRINDQMTTNVQ